MDDQVYMVTGTERSNVRPEPFYKGAPLFRPHLRLRPNQEHTCTLYSGDTDYDWVAAHEFGHLLGLEDQYNRRTGVPFAGWGNSIMALRWKPVDQRLIDLFCKLAKARKAWHVFEK